MRPALIPILLNSVPGWVRNAYPADVLPSLSLAAHYDQDLYWVRGRGQCSIDGIQTCTRAQTVPSYATTASGLLVPYAANTNRRTDLGALAEQAATNLALQSAFGGAAGTPWSLFGTTITTNAATAPDNTVTAALIKEDSSVAFHRIGTTTNIATAASTAYTLFLYAKTGPGSKRWLWINPNFSGGGSVSVTVDLTDGTTSGVSGSPTVVTQVRGGFVFIAVTFTTSVGTTSTDLRIGLNNAVGAAASYTGDGTSGNYVSSAQLELGSFPTSYIPTTTVAVMRAADAITSTVSFLATNVGSMLASVGGTAALGGVVFNTHNSTETDPIYAKTSTTIAAYINGDKAVATLGSGTIFGAGKYAIGFDGSGHSLVGNNGTVATNAGTFNNTSTLIIGSVAGSGSFYNGYIKRITLWQNKLADAQLKALTQ